VIVTRGARGVTIADEGTIVELDAHPVQAVDTTGAGDTFAAWLAVEVARGRSLRESVDRARVAAALSTIRTGARAAMPRPGDVDAARREGGAQ
jgi:ribokinase